MNNYEERIKHVIADQADQEYGFIQPGQSLINDLYFDSLDHVEAVMALEDEFGIDIDDNDWEKLLTVEQVIEYVINLVNQKLHEQAR